MPSNAARAQVADRAIRAMGVSWVDEYDPEANLTDMLADLMHWADRQEIDFDDCLRVARDHFGCEIAEECQIH